MKKNSNYTVQIMRHMECVASNVFTNKTDATNSAEKIIDLLKDTNPSWNSYAMIWQDKQLINYIN